MLEKFVSLFFLSFGTIFLIISASAVFLHIRDGSIKMWFGYAMLHDPNLEERVPYPGKKKVRISLILEHIFRLAVGVGIIAIGISLWPRGA